MIKHHPTDELIAAYIADELPTTISLAISAHIEMCPKCQLKAQQFTELKAKQSFSDSADLDQEDLSFMLDEITADESLDDIVVPQAKSLVMKDQEYQLPRALNNLELGSWFRAGNLSRARVNIDEDELRCNLVHFAPGSEVPQHTHNGFEVTLLLSGCFKDEMGEYQKGDFIWLNGEHNHRPHTEEGCLCLTVANDSLHFTEGFSRLLNPIGKLIY